MEYITHTGDLVRAWLETHWLMVVGIIIGSYLIKRFGTIFLERLIRRTVRSNNVLSKQAEVKRENTLIRITNGTLSILITIIAAMMLLSEFGLDIGPLLAAAGVVGLALGFGGQYLIKDIITGLFLILENQYRVGDVACFDNTCGLVEDISLRMTTLRDLDGTVHHVPHGEIKRVANLTKNYSRVNLNVRVDYQSDLDHVIKVINRVGQELSDDPTWKESIIKAPQFLRVDNFGDSAIEIKILGDTQPIKQWDVMGELRLRLKKAFDKEGITIPLPQRIVHINKG